MPDGKFVATGFTFVFPIYNPLFYSKIEVFNTDIMVKTKIDSNNCFILRLN